MTGSVDKRKYGYLASLGHFTCDVNSGALPAILPFLIIHADMSYTAATGLVFAHNFISAIIQPYFGNVGDKSSRPWLMSAGILCMTLGISLIGFMNNYWAMFAAAMISGVGSAMFHPEGGKIANMAADKNKKGSGMSIFSVGGNIGFVVGPSVAAITIAKIGLHGSAVFLIPSLIIALFIFLQTKKLREVERAVVKEIKESHAEDDRNSFAKSAVMLSARSVVTSGMTTFVPLIFIMILMQSEQFGSSMISVFSAANIVATIAGGQIADRVGFNKVIKVCFTAMPVVLLGLALSHNVALSVLLVVLVSFTTSGCYSSAVALSQQYMPNRLGLASGIAMGATVSVGGAFSPVLGMVGDHFGLVTVMLILAAVAAVGAVIAHILPKPREV